MWKTTATPNLAGAWQLETTETDEDVGVTLRRVKYGWQIVVVASSETTSVVEASKLADQAMRSRPASWPMLGGIDIPLDALLE